MAIKKDLLRMKLQPSTQIGQPSLYRPIPDSFPALSLNEDKTINEIVITTPRNDSIDTSINPVIQAVADRETGVRNTCVDSEASVSNMATSSVLGAFSQKRETTVSGSLDERETSVGGNDYIPIFDEAKSDRESAVSTALDEREISVIKQAKGREADVRQEQDTSETSVSGALDQPADKREQKSIRQVKKDKPMREASVSNSDTLKYLSALTGNEEKLIQYIYTACKLKPALETDRITTKMLRNYLNISADHLRDLIRRLKNNKNILQVIEVVNGGLGFRRFALTQEVFDKLSLNSSSWITHLGREPTVSRDIHEREHSREKNGSYSSNKDIKDFITTNVIPSDWDFDIQPFQCFGFGPTQIKQLMAVGNLDPFIIQQSLEEYKFDIDNKTLKPGVTLYTLMGVLRKGGAWHSVTYHKQISKLEKELAEEAENSRKAALKNKLILWESKLNDSERSEIIKKMPSHLINLYKLKGVNDIQVEVWLYNQYVMKIEKN